MKQVAHFTSLVLLACTCLSAQNSDVGFLFGFSQRNASIRDGVIRGEVKVGFQVNYAWQLVEGRGGRLYVELPVQFVAGSNGELGDRVIGRAGGIVFVTPGLRYHFNLTPRLAIYAAGGGGIAHKEERFGSRVGDQIVEVDRPKTGGAFNFGGGLDFRLTKLWSLRGEVRSFRTTEATTLQTNSFSRRSVLAQFGFALHF
ncbi:MAG: outer membrane beta-barrel protein [Acidobacteria bacterium]|nr:outer membrane beta-barrel protein [Acidobacteriota bacterium]